MTCNKQLRQSVNGVAFISSDAYMAKAAKCLFICLDHTGYELSLERRKVYVALPATNAERNGYCRIIDEFGEGYF